MINNFLWLLFVVTSHFLGLVINYIGCVQQMCAVVVLWECLCVFMCVSFSLFVICIVCLFNFCLPLWANQSPRKLRLEPTRMINIFVVDFFFVVMYSRTGIYVLYFKISLYVLFLYVFIFVCIYLVVCFCFSLFILLSMYLFIYLFYGNIFLFCQFCCWLLVFLSFSFFFQLV